jgi:hypothetical protein
MAVIQDMLVDQGITHVEIYTLEVLTDPTLPYDAGTNPYVPLDITTGAIQMQVRPTYNSGTVLLTATDLNGRFVKTDPINGVMTLTLQPSDTSSITFTNPTVSYPYDIQVKFSSLNVIKVCSGMFVLNREVTRI